MTYVCLHAKSLQLCPTLCDPMDGSQPGSSSLGFLSPGDPADPGIGPKSLMSRALASGFFTSSATWQVHNDIYPAL